jgi:protein involved in polysaccharide export with SLBB domain
MIRERRREVGGWVLLAGLFAPFYAGCSVLSGFGLLPERQELTPDADRLRQAAGDGLPRELDAPPLGEYVVGPGDGLLVVPVNLDSPARLPSDQTVLPDGTIDLGEYGSLRAAGKTVNQIEVEVNQLVAARVAGAGFIDVRLVNRESKKIYVVGEVNAPGTFPYTGNETVLDAVMGAGGLTEKASRWDIILSRPTPPDGCRLILAVNYLDVLQLGDTTTNYKLLPGDRVYVPTRTLLENLCGGKRFWKRERRPQVSCPLPPLRETESPPAECHPESGRSDS